MLQKYGFCRDLSVFLDTRHEIRRTGAQAHGDTGTRDVGGQGSKDEIRGGDTVTREHRMLEGTGARKAHSTHESFETGFEN